MIDLLTIIASLQRERRDNNIEPDHVEFASLMNEVAREVRSELNRLYQYATISTARTLNGTGVFVKEESLNEFS